jgi:outer membrane protein TolC
VAQGRVYDAQRYVVVAADNLRAELTLLGNASSGGSAGLGGRDERPQIDRVRSSAILYLNLPIERTRERKEYRESLILMEQTLREQSKLEDRIKLEIRGGLRTLLEARESIQIQAKSVEVAEKRVASTNKLFKLGRIQTRDVLEAQDSQLEAKNSLTSAVIAYRIGELKLQRDMGLLKVGADGKWQEFISR